MTTFTYSPNKDGVAEACRMLAAGLVSFGHEVWVATSMGTENNPCGEKFYVQEHVRVVDFYLEKRPSDSSALNSEIVNLKNFVIEGDFDVIITQCWDPPVTRHLLPILTKLKAKLVMVSHGYGNHTYVWQRRMTMGIGIWIRGMISTAKTLPKMIQIYDKFVFLSTKKDLSRYFDHFLADWLDQPKIEVIANGINLKQFPETAGGVRTRHGIGDGTLALCVANYGERKNQRLSVEVFRKANISGSTLVFIGSELNAFGVQAMEYDRQLAETYSDCRVVFLEKLTREETFCWFVACDFFLLTAKAETQPIVIIEAMAAGKPWVSTDTGCVSEMAGGLVFGKKSGLIKGICALSKDAKMRAKLGAEGQAAAYKHHDSIKNINRFNEMLKKLIAV